MRPQSDQLFIRDISCKFNDLKDKELSNSMSIRSYTDPYESKTWPRILVEKLLIKIPFYYPQKNDSETDDKDRPSLLAAWAFFEHHTLPRCYNSDSRTRAIPGLEDKEQQTKLYSVWSTTEADLSSSFGIGIALYFSTVRMISALFFIVGFLNVPKILYFASDEYKNPENLSSDSNDNLITSIENVLNTFKGTLYEFSKASAVCPYTREVSVIGVDETRQQNLCDATTYTNGWITLASLIVVIIGFVVITYLYALQYEEADENQMASSDYSIVIVNPPPDATDPDEWRNFFHQFDDNGPPLVTIAVDNSALLKKLVQLRSLKMKLAKRLISSGEDPSAAVEDLMIKLEDKRSDNGTVPEDAVSNIFKIPLRLLQHIGFLTDELVLLDQIQKCKSDVLELKDNMSFPVSRVFVTMETEEGQRKALKALDTGSFTHVTNGKLTSTFKYRFRDHLLQAREAWEPDATRWLELSTPLFARIIQQGCTLCVTIALILLQGTIYHFIRISQEGFFGAAVFISIVNILIPPIMKLLVSKFEHHANAGRHQISLYLKITLFRWVNTAIIILLETDNTAMLSAQDNKNDTRELIPSIASLLFLEITMIPFLRVFDVIDQLRKHVIAPRCKTQAQMNSHFQGTKVMLAERYTDLTKLLFLCLLYSPIFPLSFFVGGVAVALQYATDKFCLLRVWANEPNLGGEIGEFSNKYMFRLSVLGMAISTCYFWTGLPFDNICETGNGDFELCDQNLFGTLPFPPRPNQPWMDETQTFFTRVFNWTTVISCILFFIFSFGLQVARYALSIFTTTYQPHGYDMRIDFSSIYDRQEIRAYIPQVNCPGDHLPVLACDVGDLREDLIGWKNSDTNSYENNNLIHEIPNLLSSTKTVFSIVKHWPRFEYTVAQNREMD